MEITTGSDRARHSRRLVMELLGSASELDRAGERLDRWMTAAGAEPERFGASGPESPREAPVPGHHHPADPNFAATVAEPAKVEDELYVRDYGRCILCYRCVDACGVEHQNTFAIAVAGRGFDARISTEFDVVLPDSACVYCGNSSPSARPGRWPGRSSGT